MDEQQNKPFRASKTGQKIKRKLKEQLKTKPKTAKNPKAFTFKSIIRARKAQKRTADRAHKREHAPVTNRTTAECVPPPLVVAVVGPPKVGKSLLVKSLVRHYARRAVGRPEGPMTVVSGKTKRLTFVECPSDITAMIDCAKVADLVLLLIDAKYGFEMETFEFISILQTHGFPKVIGVLTHLDLVQPQKQVKKTKKELKKRFWQELYPGAKLFFLSRLKYGRYLDIEVRNLARFISVAKTRPLLWRNSHPFLLVDRFEDLSRRDGSDGSDHRSLSLYGFVRGTNLRLGTTVHFLGVGDFPVASVQAVADPIPLPDAARRRISEADKKVYAPMASVGDVICDEDAVYIDLKDHRINFSEGKSPKAETEGQRLVRTLQGEAPRADRAEAPFRLFREGGAVAGEEARRMQREGDSLSKAVPLGEGRVDVYSRMTAEDVVAENGAVERKVVFRKDLSPDAELAKLSESDSDLESCEETKLDLKKAIRKMKATGNTLMDTIYKTETNAAEKPIESELFDKSELKRRFVVGLNDSDENGEKSDDGDELENGLKTAKIAKKKAFDSLFDKAAAKGGAFAGASEAQLAAAQETLNAEEFAGDSKETQRRLRGFLPGTYVRVVLEGVPREFVDRFDAKFPVVLGGCLPQEDGLSFVQTKIKKHRWRTKTLKNGDPLIFSIGWRRFQSLPVFSVRDANGRQRMVKYAPENAHCLATFWGPKTPPGTGLFAFSGLEAKKDQYQIAVSGVIEETNESFKIMKKLKLVGEAYRIEKNTAFLKGLFNSALEAAKFEGAAIRTVSGIRGSIKKALPNSDPGNVRATFEDKILYSDLVFLRCWAPVPLQKFYHPLSTRLEPLGADGRPSPLLLRASGELRREADSPSAFKPDSVYRPVKRVPKVFAPLVVPRKLQTALPFASKPKAPLKAPQPTFQQRRPSLARRETKAVDRLVDGLATIRNAALAKQKAAADEKLRKRQREERALLAGAEAKDKERRKRRYALSKRTS